MYMAVIAPATEWDAAKVELWKDCGKLGAPGTKEKEQNIQQAIFDKGQAL